MYLLWVVVIEYLFVSRKKRIQKHFHGFQSGVMRSPKKFQLFFCKLKIGDMEFEFNPENKSLSFLSLLARKPTVA